MRRAYGPSSDRTARTAASTTMAARRALPKSTKALRVGCIDRQPFLHGSASVYNPGKLVLHIRRGARKFRPRTPLGSRCQSDRDVCEYDVDVRRGGWLHALTSSLAGAGGG